jgi:CRP-like cAMP-binding protein
MTREQSLEMLTRSVDLFKGIPAEQLLGFVEGSTISQVEKNEAFVRTGDDGRFLGILLEGEVEISVTDDSGEKHLLAVLRSGEVFGEMALLSNEKTAADVVARTSCKALLVPRTVFSTLLATHPPALAHLSRLVIARLKSSPPSEEGQGSRLGARWMRDHAPSGVILLHHA